MRITWITRSFLDYRVPVYAALDKLCGGQLTLIYNGEVVPERVINKVNGVLGARAIGLMGEMRIGGKKRDNATMANKGLRIPIQKGLVSAIKESKPDVMISDGFFQWTYAPLWVRATRGIPHVMCYERTKHTERNAGKMRTAYRKMVMRWIDGMDCNGSLTEEYVRSIGYDKPIALGHMTADTENLSRAVEAVSNEEAQALRESLGCKSTVYLYVGQLIPRKGMIELLKIWKAASLEDASLLFVGDGSQREEIEKYIANEGIKDVILAGRVDYDSIAPYYKMADYFIIATLEDNWSLVVPEAMSTGLPVICSIYNGCWPELVTKDNGYTFDPLDTASSATVLRESYANRASAQLMGAKSKEIIKNHTPEIAAANLYNLCKDILKK